MINEDISRAGVHITAGRLGGCDLTCTVAGHLSRSSDSICASAGIIWGREYNTILICSYPTTLPLQDSGFIIFPSLSLASQKIRIVLQRRSLDL